jgi:CRP/FNR family transcriptional regulator, cyclic AMP receptor protein
MDTLLERHVRENEAAESRFIDVSIMNEWFADDIARTHAIKKRQLLYLLGDPADYVYILKAGTVKTSTCDETGKEVTLAILKPGDFFGVVEAFDGTPHTAYAEALEDSMVAVIHQNDFVRRIREHPGLAFVFTRFLLRHFRTLESRVRDLVLRDAPSRLAHLLLDLGETTRFPCRNRLRVDIKLTHQEMANVVGCARETVSTILGHFREQGVIRTHGRSITILNREAVSRQCPR